MKKGLRAEQRKGLLLSFLTLGLVGTLSVIPMQFRSNASVSKQESTTSSWRTESHRPGFEDYDIRLDKSSAVENLKNSFRSAAGRTEASAQEAQKDFASAEKDLQRRFPTLAVDYNADMNTPAMIGSKAALGRHFLTAASSQKRSEILRNFVKNTEAIVGLTDQQIDDLKVTADYTNPDGNMSFAMLEQFINGFPVYRAELKAGFSKSGEMVRVVNNLAPGLDYDSLSTDFGSPETAVRAAFKHIPREIKAEDTQLNAALSNDLKTTFGEGYYPTTAEKIYFPIESGVARSAWRVLIWEDVAAYYVIVDAETGEMLSRENIGKDQTQAATYNVYANTTSLLKSLDSPAPMTPGPIDPSLGTQGLIASRTNVTLIGNEAPYTFNNNGWINDGANATEGNNTLAGLDRFNPNGPDNPMQGSGNRVFNYAYNPAPGSPAPGDDPVPTGQTINPCGATAPATISDSQKGAVVQMFYVVNRYHDETYRLGFTEQARNFQGDNFGRNPNGPNANAIAGNDRVLAEGQDCSGVNNANFNTPLDGTSGRMQMYVFTGPTPDRDGTIDADIIIHELTHGLFGRLHNGTGGTQGGQMHEGNADFWAHAMLSEASDPINGIYTTGGYATLNWRATPPFNNTGNYYYGIRRFPKAVMAFTGGPNNRPHNPLTFADIDPAQINVTDGAYGAAFAGSATAVHDGGEIWSSALWEVRAKLIQRLGHAEGTRKTLQFVMDGMKLAQANPTMLQERSAIIAAAQASGTAADVADVWAGFAVRGFGFGATNTTGNTVVESMNLPNAEVAANGFAVSDAAPGGDGDGYPEPGETLQLTVPVTNESGSTVNNVTVQVTGGGNANYGSIANGQTVTRAISYTVPANAQCGSLHTVSLVLSSPIGTNSAQTRTFRLGAPVGGAPLTFTNNTAINIPNGQPTTTTGAASPYPSSITVSGLTGQKIIRLKLNSFSHSFPGDVDMLLVGPGGQKMIVMSDLGGGDDAVNLNVDLIDTATNALPTAALASGEYRPGNSGANDTTFGTPAPAGPYSNPAPAGTDTLSSVFGTNAANLNGTWSLYVWDDASTDSGVLAGGWSLSFESNDYNCNVTPQVNKARVDFDGDGKTDRSVYRNGTWFAQRSSQGFAAVQFGGAAGDVPLIGDFNADGKADTAIWRPVAGNGTEPDVWVLNGGTNTITSFAWGVPNDIPLVADFDGNGTDQIAVYRPSNNTFYVYNGAANPTIFQQGAAGDIPVALYYDNDAFADLATWRPSTGVWTIRQSSGGTATVAWGQNGDKLVVGDYDNDNRDDLAVYRNGAWFIRRTATGAMITDNFGNATDVPVVGDYDGDGDDEPAVYRGGSWIVRDGSASGFNAQTFGLGSDTAVPSIYNR